MERSYLTGGLAAADAAAAQFEDRQTLDDLLQVRGSETRKRAEPARSVGYWSSFPSGWILDGGLKSFREELRFAGRSTAALKLLSVVIMAAGDARRRGASGGEFSAQVTNDELNNLAGLSRPLAVAAKKFLCSQGVISVVQDPSSGRTLCSLQDNGSATLGSIHHASALKDAVDGVARLSDLSCRQVENLRAMKVFMLLCGLRRQAEESVVTSRAEIVRLTGLRESHVASALVGLKSRKMIAGDLRVVRACAGTERFTLRTCPL
jgi:hypothetical protein